MAVLFGFQVAMESGFKDLEVETDAANLAKLALSVDQQIVWLEDYPSCVGSYVASNFPCNL
ncbi:hypothetical protein ACOSQ2_024205 [Xanthoceras sorbifolium]